MFAASPGGGGGIAVPVASAPEAPAATIGPGAGKFAYSANDASFSFKSSEEYGYTQAYGLEIIEALWQTRDKNKVFAKDNKWAERPIPGVDSAFSTPHPGNDAWNSTAYKTFAEADTLQLDPDSKYLEVPEAVTLAGNYPARPK